MTTITTSNATTTAEDVLREIALQLAWRGPSGRPMGHVVVEREKMLVLMAWIEERRDGQR